LDILLALKLIPPQVMADCRARAQAAMHNGKPASQVAAAVIIIVCLAAAALVVKLAVGIIG